MPRGVEWNLQVQNIVLLHEGRMSVDDIELLTEIPARSIRRILERRRKELETGQVQVKKKRGRPSKLGPEDMELVLTIISTKPDIYLDELQTLIMQRDGSYVSLSTICRALAKDAITKKKIAKLAIERNEEKRAAYVEHMARTYIAKQLVFVDESAVDKRSYIRNRGWATRGERCIMHHPFMRGRRYSILPALAIDGMIHCQIIENSYNSVKFRTFIERLLERMNPYPQEKSVVVMDNCAIHKDVSIRELIEAKGCRLEYLPPYSPDYNPIELAFGKLKSNLRREGKIARSIGRDDKPVFDQLYEYIYQTSAKDALSFFRYSGYA